MSKDHPVAVWFPGMMLREARGARRDVLFNPRGLMIESCTKDVKDLPVMVSRA